jgi:hypothetical protein
MNPYDLDWGNITPSGYSEDKNEVLHVFNFDISSKEHYWDTKRNYLGISVKSANMSLQKINAFKNSVAFLINEGHTVYELYNSSKLSKENIDVLSKQFMSPR